MTITYYRNVDQGSDEWVQMRCGMLTASEMSLILTPTLKIASNDKERMHLYELLGQRILSHVEPMYIGDDMLRGWEDEIRARELYRQHVAPVDECGFITNDAWGFKMGYSPDGLVGDDGLIECKSRRQKYQIQTIAKLSVPDEHLLQVQAGLLISDRKWLDYVSFCAGLPMMILRVYPDDTVQNAIIEAASAFEQRLSDLMKAYGYALQSDRATFIDTQRTPIEEDPFAQEYD
jgi:YqaJ-like viral recombinase domain